MPIDRKGELSYLAITFAITWAVEGGLVLSGFRIGVNTIPLYGQLAVAAVMWVPALTAFLTTRFITREGIGVLNLRFGAARAYLLTALLIPVAYVVIYALTALLGLGRPDWQLVDFLARLRSMGVDVAGAPPGPLLLAGLFAGTTLVTPFMNSLFGLGEEIGWRGFLLPRLMPLGKAKAYLLVGVIWGLWHAPLVLVGFNYAPYNNWLGILAMCGLTTAFGIFVNELTLRHNSTILAGWMHGVFNSQSYGIWRILFVGVNPLLGGITGVVSMAVWAGLGGWIILRGKRIRK
jgi:uncharacterized protein